jgi:cation diffusion facilitator family transporter
MDDCCNEKAHELAQLQGRVLRAVLAINAAMFAIEFLAGLLAGSMALLGDSLDMLGDTLVYGLSLYALHRGAVWQARAALSKGMVMLGFGAGVLLETVHKLVVGSVPPADVMGLVGTVALAANAVCFALLYRHRSDGLNMRSTWLCSRNDIIGNVAVLAAAVAVAALGSRWPDLLVGAGVAVLFLRTAAGVIRESVLELSREQPGAQRAG